MFWFYKCHFNVTFHCFHSFEFFHFFVFFIFFFRIQLSLKMFFDNFSKIQKLFNVLNKHFDWFNDTTFSFISIYVDYVIAFNNVIAQTNQNKKKKIIVRINVSKCDERIWYRNVRIVKNFFKFRIERQIWKNSQYEYIFFHRISRKIVVKIISMFWMNFIHRTLTKFVDH